MFLIPAPKQAPVPREEYLEMSYREGKEREGGRGADRDHRGGYEPGSSPGLSAPLLYYSQRLKDLPRETALCGIY